MTQTEFLLDTLKYYCEDTSRRCKHPQHEFCRYHPSTVGHTNSEGCAIGRHLLKELALKFDSYDYTGVEDVFDELPENLQILEVEFLESIQNFHDSASSGLRQRTNVAGNRLDAPHRAIGSLQNIRDVAGLFLDHGINTRRH